MDRRAFLAGAAGLLATPLAAEAQPAGKVYRIGFLGPGGSPTPTNPIPRFRQGLTDLGYVEGRDFVMEYRWAAGHLDRLPELAADLVRAKVDLIVTSGTPGTRAAKDATQIIPIVFMSASNVVERGIVRSLARPGGNMTGLSLQVGPEKLFQLFKEAVPTVVRVAYLYDPAMYPGEFLESFQQRLHSHAQAQNLKLQMIAVHDLNSLPAAFAEIKTGTNGLMFQNSTPFVQDARRTCGLAIQRRLPAIGYGREFAEAGCLMSVGEDILGLGRRAAWFVDRILKGAKPNDLPVEQPTKVELVINLKTAKALGLTIPRSLLVQADQVIE